MNCGIPDGNLDEQVQEMIGGSLTDERGQQLEDVADQVEVPIPNLIPNFKFPAEGKYDLNMKY